MASRTIRPKNNTYGVIQRGCSLTIPVSIKDVFEEPLDLTECNVSFTIKQVSSDYDREDERAFIKKDFIPQEPIQGRFFVQLSSKDTDIPPGNYFMDIEINNLDTGMVYRLCTLSCEIQGGPTNRTTNDGIGQLAVGDEVTIVTLEQGSPIIIIAPAVAIDPNTYNDIELLIKKVKQLEKDSAHQMSIIQVLNEHVAEIEKIVFP